MPGLWIGLIACASFAALWTGRAALAADYACPVEGPPAPQIAWPDVEIAAADELYRRARNGLRHWSRDPELLFAIRESLLELIRREPDGARGYVELARFAMVTGTTGRFVLTEEAYDFAEQALDYAIALDPADASAWALEALFRLHRRDRRDPYGNGESVDDALEEAERLAPDSSDVAFAWASWYALRFEYASAIERMERLLEQEGLGDSVAAAAYRRLGEYYSAAGRLQAALEAVEQAVARERYDPRNLLLYSSLVLEQRGDAETASVAARLAFCLYPTVEANQRLAYALYVAWAIDNEGQSEPDVDDERLAEAVRRDPDIDDVMGYISEHERLAPLVHVLVQAGTDADLEDPEDGSTALMDAVQNGRLEDADLLIQSGADANHTDTTGMTLLMTAAWNRDLPMARLLIAHGADVNALTPVGTPLILAVTTRQEEIARLLIEAGADVDLTTDQGETALTRAAFDDNGSTQIVRMLLEAGANPYHEYAPGESVIKGAEEMHLTGIAELLREAAERSPSAR